MRLFNGRKPTLSGQALTNGLRGFNNRLEPFLIEAAMPLLIIGFITGTVDLFTGGSLATNSIFEYVWATVQGIAIDGLFFSVWFQVKRATWTSWKGGLRAIALIIIGLALGFVAMVVNDVLSLQQVSNIASSVAMQRLSIDSVTFTHIRAALVVVVAILVALVREEHQEATLQDESSFTTTTSESQERKERARQPRRQQAIGAHRPPLVALPQRTTLDRNLEDVARSANHQRAIESPATGYVAIDNGATVAVADGQGQAMIATGSHRDRIKGAMLRAMQEGRELNYKEIAEVASVGYSTVKKYAPEIREELTGVVEAPGEKNPS